MGSEPQTAASGAVRRPSADRKGAGRDLKGDTAVVTDTGIALVHEGEFIYAAPGSEAEVALAETDSRMAVHIHLPVIIEVVGEQDSGELDRIVDETFRRLRRAVEAR